METRAAINGHPVLFLDGDTTPELAPPLAIFDQFKLSLRNFRSKGLLAAGPAEQGRMRPLLCGASIQNVDSDKRLGGNINAGTLGFFSALADGRHCLVSCAHVLSAQNKGVLGEDRIQQPPDFSYFPDSDVAELLRFTPIVASPAGARVNPGMITFNRVDAACALLNPSMRYRQAYDATRPKEALPPTFQAPAKIDMPVHKVGRTTNITWGVVKYIGVQLGPLTYSKIGECWFENCIVVQGINGPFSAGGDSGSAVVGKNGELIGIVFATAGQLSWVIPIAAIIPALGLQVPEQLPG